MRSKNVVSKPCLYNSQEMKVTLRALRYDAVEVRFTNTFFKQLGGLPRQRVEQRFVILHLKLLTLRSSIYSIMLAL